MWHVKCSIQYMYVHMLLIGKYTCEKLSCQNAEAFPCRRPPSRPPCEMGCKDGIQRKEKDSEDWNLGKCLISIPGSWFKEYGGGLNMFPFHPYLGRWSKLTSIFQMGWNHQLEARCWVYDTILRKRPQNEIISTWSCKQGQETTTTTIIMIIIRNQKSYWYWMIIIIIIRNQRS